MKDNLAVRRLAMARWGCFVSRVALMVGLAWLMVGCERTPAQTPAEAAIAGEWDGMMGKLHLALTFEPKDGGWTGTLVSVDQGNATVPINSVSFGAGKLTLGLTGIGASFVGTLDGAGTSFSGTWSQSGATLPLVLHRPGIVPQTAAFTLKPRTIGTVAMVPCRTPDGNTEGLCGRHAVWENRTLKSGRKLSLKIMVLPALDGAAAADGFFPLAGGPGQSAIEAFPLTGYTAEVRKTRDVVLVDQRGVGGSAALDCALRDPKNAQQTMGEELPLERLRACRAKLEQNADLTQYTTSIFADDLDEVRAALGYDMIDVLGGSYGTRAALVYLRQHGQHVRTMTLEGVVPPEYRIPLSFSEALDRSLNRIFAKCAADASCAKGYPGLQTEFVTVLNRLEKKPAQAQVKMASGMQAVTISKGGFVMDLRPILYVPQVVNALPYLVHKAYEGDFAPYASVAVQVRMALDRSINRDLSLSVACAEDVPGMTEALIAKDTKGTYLGDYQVRQYQRACAEWARGGGAEGFSRGDPVGRACAAYLR